MRNFFILSIFGIACNYCFTQIDESSFTYDYTNITTSNEVGIDTSLVFGKLEVSFDVADTLAFKGLQVQLVDSYGNTISNEVYLKNQLIADGKYTIPNVILDLGYKLLSDDYVIWLSYLHINGVEFPQVTKNITYD